MSLTAKAAIAILTSIKTSFIEKFEIVDIDEKTTYGALDVTEYAQLRKKHHKEFVTVTSNDEQFLVGVKSKKTIRELSNRKIVPEGMVKFPGKTAVLISVYGPKISVKEKDKLLARLIPSDVKDIVVEDGGFFVKGSKSEWHAFPYLVADRPNTTLWAVRDNHMDSKLAFVFEYQKEAFEKLRKFAADLSASIAKKAA